MVVSCAAKGPSRDALIRRLALPRESSGTRLRRTSVRAGRAAALVLIGDGGATPGRHGRLTQLSRKQPGNERDHSRRRSVALAVDVAVDAAGLPDATHRFGEQQSQSRIRAAASRLLLAQTSSRAELPTATPCRAERERPSLLRSDFRPSSASRCVRAGWRRPLRNPMLGSLANRDECDRDTAGCRPGQNCRQMLGRRSRRALAAVIDGP